MASGNIPAYEDRWAAEVALYLLLTFGLSFAIYSLVFAGNRGWLGVRIPTTLSVVGILAPGIVAVAIHIVAGGHAGLRVILDQSMRWRFHRRWWVAVLGIPPALIGATYGGYLLTGAPITTAWTTAVIRDMGPMAIVAGPVLVAVTLILAYGEELGWRGYLLPRLQQRFSALTASLILGVLWFLWHLPLIALPGGENVGFPVWLWGISIGALAFVYTWLFNITGGSVLAVTLFHGGLNVWGRFVALHPNETGESLSAFFIAGGNVVLAVMVVLAFGWKTLARTPEGGSRVTSETERWIDWRDRW